MIKFKSKVVRVNEMGGKWVVEFKEKQFLSEDGETPSIDTATVELYKTAEDAMEAIEGFIGN